jgi:thiosulfate dehydrogenase (quinone) large subunit
MRLPGEILQGILARAALALLRVYLGTVFLVAAIPKLQGDFTSGMAGFLQGKAMDQSHLFYRDFLRDVVLPNVHLFARLVNWGELLAGVLLVLGLMTRLSAAVTFLLTLNYMLAKGAWPWMPSSNDAALAVMSLAIMIGAAGRTLGLDSMLARRWPRSPFW